MITELDAITAAEEILSQHWGAICASERLEVQIAQAQPAGERAEPQRQPDMVTLKDVLVCLLAALLLLAVLGRLA
jgi:hypothetical protein